jgi:diguanylate cyclase (GGDEF)-like protein
LSASLIVFAVLFATFSGLAVTRMAADATDELRATASTSRAANALLTDLNEARSGPLADARLRDHLARLLALAGPDEALHSQIERLSGLAWAETRVVGRQTALSRDRITAGPARAVIAELVATSDTKFAALGARLDYFRALRWWITLGGGSLLTALVIGLTLDSIAAIRRPLAALAGALGTIDRRHESDAPPLDVEGAAEFRELGRAFEELAGRLRLEAERRAAAERELLATNAHLLERGQTLEQRNRAIEVTRRMAQRLSGCTTEAEWVAVIQRFVPQLIPDLSGALYVTNEGRKLFAPAAHWGLSRSSRQPFGAEDCWALRRGRPHVLAEPGSDIVCRHIEPGGRGSYCCLPLVAHGETLGLIYLDTARSALEGRASEDLLALAETMASALANLRLRLSLQAQSIRDPLTGLFNRRYLQEAWQVEAARALRANVPIALTIVDVDHFKRFNDRFGHDAGDYVLEYVSRTLQRNARAGDIVCRYGGDEFVLLQYGSSRSSAREAAERLREAIKAQPLQHGDVDLGTVTVSIGVADCPRTGRALEAIVKVADRSLYLAKKEGRDRVVTIAAGPSSVATLPTSSGG